MSDEPPSGPVDDDAVSLEELQLATRNHGMPLEALRYDTTPIGLHYLLIHFDIPEVPADDWQLTVDGSVARPLSLDLGDLRRRPAVTTTVTLECAGNGRATLRPRPVSQPWLREAVGNARWTGTPLAPILEEAGLTDDAVEVVFTGLDRGVEDDVEQPYRRSLTIDQATRDDVLLAYELSSGSHPPRPLPPQHGFPVRLLVPGWYGMASVKWLTRIEAVDEPFTGHYQTSSYVFRREPDDEGTPVTRIAVRSLMVPPGIPEFLSRRRLVDAGPVTLEGRAWSGSGAVERVEVSIDGGRTWGDASVHPSDGPYAWHRWTFGWDAERGDHELLCRATDAEGDTQPLEPTWNVGGYGANAVQRVPVTVG